LEKYKFSSQFRFSDENKTRFLKTEKGGTSNMKTQKSTRNMKQFHLSRRYSTMFFGRITLIGLIICCIAVLPAFAGTWRDDFEDGDLAGWEIGGGGANWENWKVENGELLLSNQGSLTVFSTGGAGWSDYTVQADVMIVKVLTPQLAGPAIMARYQKPESYEHYFFGFRWENGVWRLGLGYMHNDAAWRNHDYAKLEQFPVEEGRWYNLRMTLAKDHIEAYLDNELIAEWDNKLVDSGKVGLRGTDIEARFDNVVITGDEIPDVVPSGVELVGKLATMWGSTKRGR